MWCMLFSYVKKFLGFGLLQTWGAEFKKQWTFHQVRIPLPVLLAKAQILVLNFHKQVLSSRGASPSLVYKLTYSHRVAHELAKLAFIIKNCLWIEEAPFVVLVEYKVFEYFASCRTPEGELLMKPVDLMRAVVPVFPPSESKLVREGYLNGERSPGHLFCLPSEFFMLFDVDNDGLISFKEHIFFVTLLSIQESSFSAAFRMFDKDNDGEIDKEEFKKVMQSMRSHTRQGVQHRDGRRTGLRANASVENGGLMEYLFGKDGNGRLTHDKFVRFIRDLHDEIVRLEFAHYDYKSRKTIPAKDFAHSIVASADLSHLGRLLERVDELSNDPRFRDVRITFDEFKNFAELRKKLSPFSSGIFSFAEVQGLLTRDDFQRAASHVCGLSLSDNVVEIVFHLFDANEDGNLSTEEFVSVLQHRERDIAQPVETGIMGFLSCCWKCKDTSPSSRLLS
ncbi:hypothetical protein JHK85_009496 [Glycine max]|nr:hypothetical protein JHK85_009496 [Glycine max]